MNPLPANFDSLVRGYRALEYFAFGRDLERARFCFLDQLAGCRSILVLGEGDGRCLAQLVRIAPAARIHCLDASAAMLARARARLTDPAVRARVSFEQADALSAPLPAAHYDAVLTFFFLDCFTAAQTAVIISRVRPSLRPDALWLFADFVLPPRGFSRWRARLWLALLYAFFRWRTGLGTRNLPPSEEILAAAGFRRSQSRDFQGGLLRSSVFRPDRGERAPVPDATGQGPGPSGA